VSTVLTSQTDATKSHAFLTVSEVADMLRISPDTVIRYFGDRPGVLDLGSPEDVRKAKRRYRILRIPTAFTRSSSTKTAFRKRATSPAHETDGA